MIKPVGKRIVVEPKKQENVTPSGLLIPETALEKRADQGTVIESGVTIFEKGQRVLFSKYGVDEYTDGDKTYCIVHEDNVLGVFE